MFGGKILLEMLKEHDVTCVFGLPGETTLRWYDSWKDFKYIEHVMVRDERNSVFMADAYAKVSGKPGVCEGPSVGAPHMLPGIVEAWSSSVPIIAITSDIPLWGEKHNVLTGADQTSMFKAFVKESLTVHKASEIPFIVRRAFRLAVSGRPGPVHIRIPQDVFEEDIEVCDLFAQKEFGAFPGKRFSASQDDILRAADILKNALRPVFICGQGALSSGAWEEVRKSAELFGAAVLSTINGKGIIDENHPLSCGVCGARGANSFSNGVVNDADAIFIIGSSTDSVGTSWWSVPSKGSSAKIIQLNVSEAELGNNYRADVLMQGDAKETLSAMLSLCADFKKDFEKYKNLLSQKRASYEASVKEAKESHDFPINPIALMAKIEEYMPEDSILVVDPGTAAVYPAGFIKAAGGRRNFVCNFAQGALGYASSAAIGAAKASPKSTIIHITGDGSLGFCTGEYETLARTGCNVKVLLINNRSFGWIRVSNAMAFDNEPFATEFSDVDYIKIMDGFRIPADRVEKECELEDRLKELFEKNGPGFLEIPCEPEDKCVPPVPGWAEKVRARGEKNYY